MELDRGDGVRRWKKEMEGEDGGRRWREEMEKGDGGRRWKKEMEGGDGGRRWREEMEEGDGGRRWREDMEGGVRGIVMFKRMFKLKPTSNVTISFDEFAISPLFSLFSSKTFFSVVFCKGPGGYSHDIGSTALPTLCEYAPGSLCVSGASLSRSACEGLFILPRSLSILVLFSSLFIVAALHVICIEFKTDPH